MNPFVITLNGLPIQLGSALPAEIYQFSVLMFIPTQFPSEQTPQLKQWLNTIIDRLTCDYVEYNQVLIPASELTKF